MFLINKEVREVNYSTILFDLDGTIIDSSKGIIDSVKYALTKMERDIPVDKALYTFIGPPLNTSFEKNFQMNNMEVEQAITYYREYYAKKGIFEVTVYDGIQEMLRELKKGEFELYIATSKPEKFAKKIIDYLGMSGYFSGIYGASMDNSRSKKADVIRYALKESNTKNSSTVLMIGDREHDIIGGKENNIDTAGVLYGFGDYEELHQAGANIIVAKPSELLSVLKKSR